MTARQRKSGRRIGRWARWLLPLAALLLVTAALELVLRAGYFIRNRTQPSKIQFHADWGWVPTPSQNLTYETAGYGQIVYSTDANGFRVMGDPDTARTKIFVVGDSFTQAYQVSDGKAYYDYLADHGTGIELFVYGAGGYATLQQALVVRHYLDSIEPDVVLWQFHPNDLIGSDVRLEAQSGEHNNHMVRPYLDAGTVALRHPDGLLGTLAVHSVLFRRLAVARASIKKRFAPIDDKLVAGHPDLERALEAMRSVVADLVADASLGGRSFVAFQVPSRERTHYEDYVFGRICEVPGLHCVPGLDRALEAARQRGERVDGGSDPHWNETGHAIAGRVLLEYLRANGLLAGNDPNPGSVPAASG